MEDFGLFGAIKWLVIIVLVLAIPVGLVMYWYVTLPIAALIGGGIYYYKRQANRV